MITSKNFLSFTFYPGSFLFLCTILWFFPRLLTLHEGNRETQTTPNRVSTKDQTAKKKKKKKIRQYRESSGPQNSLHPPHSSLRSRTSDRQGDHFSIDFRRCRPRTHCRSSASRNSASVTVGDVSQSPPIRRPSRFRPQSRRPGLDREWFVADPVACADATILFPDSLQNPT